MVTERGDAEYPGGAKFIKREGKSPGQNGWPSGVSGDNTLLEEMSDHSVEALVTMLVY
jgi:hypothetical protein